MRIINLDETGIKLISEDKKQMYLSINEIKDFINNNFKICDNMLTFNLKTLKLSNKDIEEFPLILQYIKDNFIK